MVGKGRGGVIFKIVLVRPNFQSHIITPPLGLGYLAAYLKRHKIKVKIIDGLRDNLSLEELVEQIINYKPEAVGITCLTSFYRQVVDLSSAIKERKPEIKCIIGGVHPTFLPYETLAETKADFVVCGEGEKALVELIRADYSNKKICGVYSQADALQKKVIKKAEIVKNLDDLPFPDWEQISPLSYPKAPHGAVVKHFPVGIIISSRGCPYQCTYCASPGFYDRRIRFRSPKNVVDEIIYLHQKFGVKEIHFEDDNLTLKRSHIQKICELILKSNLQISWSCPNGIRADKIDRDLVSLMKKSGCYLIAFGVESGNQKILQKAKKNESLQTVERAIRLVDNFGLICQGFFIFGLPGETAKTIKESIEFAKRAKLTRAQFVILDVLPGSALWESLKGQFKPNWDKKSYQEPEWVPSGITKEELIAAQERAIMEFYLRPHIFWRFIKYAKPSQFKYFWRRFKDYRLFKFLKYF